MGQNYQKKHNTAQKHRNQKHHYPAKQKNHHHVQRRKPQNQSAKATMPLFNGNLAQNMSFGGEDHDLSGFVSREVVMIDRHGNKQIAREKQFFNSAKKDLSVKVHDDKRNR